MKKFYVLFALLFVFAACGPVRYQYRGSGRMDSIVQERLDRRSYRLNVEREILTQRETNPRRGHGPSVVDIPDFVISVSGDRLHNMREGNNECRITNYRDTRNSQRRTIRFNNYYRYSNTLEGKYELLVYPDGYFRLTIRRRDNSVRRQYEGRMDIGYSGPVHGHRPRR